ncbi:MAG: hypothetical protein F4X58_01470 [Chloroflexi bacterium]|nr:hypothetical protein [Chloroflexota bacterium]MYC00575.1 hypothetical protein [Chloroflexota bacterium]
MGFWRGLRWGLFLGVIAALVGRVLSGEDNKDQWEQAKVAGDIAAAQAEAEQREKFERTRRGEQSSVD